MIFINFIIIILVLFGGKKIPELARSLGKAKGEFKKGLAEGEKEEQEAEGKPLFANPRNAAASFSDPMDHHMGRELHVRTFRNSI